MQKTIVQGTRDEDSDVGRVRRTQVAIGGVGMSIDRARFIPMPPGTRLDVALRRLIDWISAPDVHGRDPIVGAAMAHYQFETLHPFTNGNGRVGRLLLVLQLLSRGVLSQPILAVSPWFDHDRERYQELLGEVSAHGAWDEWVAFFADGLADSAADAVTRANRVFDARDQYRQVVADAHGRGAIRDIVDLLVETPIVTVGNLRERLGVTFAAANTAVAKLVELGVLKLDEPAGPERQFRADEILAAITAPALWSERRA